MNKNTLFPEQYHVSVQAGEVFNNDPLFLRQSTSSRLNTKGLEGRERNFREGLFDAQGKLRRPAREEFHDHLPQEITEGRLAMRQAIAPVVGIGIRFTITHEKETRIPSSGWLTELRDKGHSTREFIPTHQHIPPEEQKHILAGISAILEKHGVPVQAACVTNRNFHEQGRMEADNAAGKTHYSKQDIIDLARERGQNQIFVDFLAPLGSERQISSALEEIHAMQKTRGGQQR